MTLFLYPFTFPMCIYAYEENTHIGGQYYDYRKLLASWDRPSVSPTVISEELQEKLYITKSR